VRRVLDPPVEAVIALRSRWAKRLPTDEGAEIRQIGRWIGIFVFDEDVDGEPFFSDVRVFACEDDMTAVLAFDELFDIAGRT
jgi:hypothetical protein